MAEIMVTKSDGSLEPIDYNKVREAPWFYAFYFFSLLSAASRRRWVARAPGAER